MWQSSRVYNDCSVCEEVCVYPRSAGSQTYPPMKIADVDSHMFIWKSGRGSKLNVCKRRWTIKTTITYFRKNVTFHRKKHTQQGMWYLIVQYLCFVCNHYFNICVTVTSCVQSRNQPDYYMYMPYYPNYLPNLLTGPYPHAGIKYCICPRPNCILLYDFIMIVYAITEHVLQTMHRQRLLAVSHRLVWSG